MQVFSRFRRGSGQWGRYPEGRWPRYLGYRFCGEWEVTLSEAPESGARLDIRVIEQDGLATTLKASKGLPNRRRFLLWAAYLLSVSRSLNLGAFGLVAVYSRTGLVFKSWLLPSCPKLPFMRQPDVRFLAVWTRPEQRRKGWARYAVSRTLHRLRKPGRHFWYIVWPGNRASVALAEACGFRYVGDIVHPSVLGIGALGPWVLVGREPEGKLDRAASENISGGWNGERSF